MSRRRTTISPVCTANSSIQAVHNAPWIWTLGVSTGVRDRAFAKVQQRLASIDVLFLFHSSQYVLVDQGTARSRSDSAQTGAESSHPGVRHRTNDCRTARGADRSAVLRMSAPHQLTDLLLRAGSGDRDALDRIFPFVYDELRRLAHRQLRREVEGHTLSTTALVHEAYVRLVDQSRARWRDRAHFLAVTATAMRRILVDHARRHRSAKRGGTLRRVPIESAELGAEERAELLVSLDDALTRLAALDARQAGVVECRFFGGLTEEETAEALGISLRTTKRDWAKAKSWLYQEIYGDAPT